MSLVKETVFRPTEIYRVRCDVCGWNCSESGPDDSVALGAASKQGFVLSASLRGQGRDLCPECYGKVWRAGAAGL